MKLSAPKKVTFVITVLIFVLGLVAALVPALKLSGYAIWIVAIAYLLLAIANNAKGM